MLTTLPSHKSLALHTGKFRPRVFGGRALLLAGLMTAACSAYGQTVSDAQVESNVLKALAGAPELASEAITTRTVYGTVTLSGSVQSEELRRRAENLAANADGVKKVVDEIRLTSELAANPPQQPALGPSQPEPGPGLVLQSDGTYAPAVSAEQPAPGTAPAESAQRNNPEADQALDSQQQPARQEPQPQALPYPPNGGPDQAGYPQGPQMQRRPVNPYPQGSYAEQGQAPGQPVVIPNGAMIRVRINRSLSSDRTPAGTRFDGIVTNDVVAGGLIAIPRGATVQGTVVDARSSGVLKGRGEMSIQLTQVVLGGKSFPIVSDLWSHHGGDKTIETINKTAGFGAAGAVLGALAGRGTGAAIGGGIGAAAGLGSSAASGNGQVYIPSEGMVTFHLAQDATVQTVSEQEMQRLAYGVAPGADQRYYRRPARVYIAPGYPPYPVYPPYGPYGPYGPYPYYR